MLDDPDDAEDAKRRQDEHEALEAIYSATGELEGSIGGPWRVKLGLDAVLELHLPPGYPSRTAPTPIIHAPTLCELEVSALAAELAEMWAGDEVVFQWAEHCRTFLETAALAAAEDGAPGGAAAADDADGADADAAAAAFALATFAESDDDDIHRVDLFHGEPFHPPKSGPGECFVAHVARVTCLGHVRWALAELKRDRKIARATHNMVAYRFWDESRGVQVSDNDDDGESGAGKKLAELLELTGSQDVLCVVSRWFGGIHLGPARFKYIAHTGREAMQGAGLCGGGKATAGAAGTAASAGGAARSAQKGARQRR